MGLMKFIVVSWIGLWVVGLPASAAGPSAPRKLREHEFDVFARTYVAGYWLAHPLKAAEAGLHKFDGALPDLSVRSIRDWINFNVAALDQIDHFNPQLLSQSKQIDLQILRYTVAGELFEFRDMKVFRRNPMTYDVSWGLLNLIRRDHAPLEQRMRSADKLLKAAPRSFDYARRNLDAVLPTVFCEVAINNLKGSAEFIRNDLCGAFRDVKDVKGLAALKRDAATAADAVDAFVGFLQSEKLPRSNGAFAIGPALFSEMLSATEGVDLPLARLMAVGEADLKRNLARLKTIAEKHFQGKSAKEVIALMKKQAYKADMLIPSIAAELDSIRAFCIDKDLITIPSEVRAVVTETPKFARWASAMMSTPGPFESVATEAYYDVTPIDPSWSAEEQHQWLADFNRYIATNVSVHEAYPGHYVQFLHTHLAPSDVQKAFVSYAAVEGWAHYTEQMMVEAGFHADDPMYEIAQIQDALLRNCRFLCAIKMHTQGMTVDQATEFFMHNALTERLASRREAERGTFDPAYLKYTLGKLQILKLRDNYKKKMGDAFSLKRFHDAFLSHGMPPIVVTRVWMLGAAGSSL